VSLGQHVKIWVYWKNGKFYSIMGGMSSKLIRATPIFFITRHCSADMGALAKTVRRVREHTPPETLEARN